MRVARDVPGSAVHDPLVASTASELVILRASQLARVKYFLRKEDTFFCLFLSFSTMQIHVYSFEKAKARTCRPMEAMGW